MDNKSETNRIFFKMSEVINKIVISLEESIAICNKRKNLYFKQYLKEFLSISPELEKRHNEVCRDHKICYRKFSLIKREIDKTLIKDIDNAPINEIKKKISDAWEVVNRTAEKDQQITDELKFVEEHIRNRKEFIEQSGVIFEENFEISEENYDIDEDEDFFDVRENNDNPF